MLCDLQEPLKALVEILGRQVANVVLERVGDEPIPHPDPRFALMMQPAVCAEKLHHGAVEVFIVRELHMAADVPGEAFVIEERRRQATWLRSSFDNLPVVDP